LDDGSLEGGASVLQKFLQTFFHRRRHLPCALRPLAVLRIRQGLLRWKKTSLCFGK
jgi:hypothetical protein